MTKEQEELFKADPLIKILLETEKLNSVELIGGAVVDILEGRKPKDYDFILNSFPNIEAKFQYETRTAKTFTKEGLILQQLKIDKADFDFKISLATLKINQRKELTLSLDDNSFNNRVLIPCDKCWIDKKNALSALRRIPHYKNKGYSINDLTYLSLLGVVGKSNNYNS